MSGYIFCILKGYLDMQDCLPIYMSVPRPMDVQILNSPIYFLYLCSLFPHCQIASACLDVVSLSASENSLPPFRWVRKRQPSLGQGVIPMNKVHQLPVKICLAAWGCFLFLSLFITVFWKREIAG